MKDLLEKLTRGVDLSIQEADDLLVTLTTESTPAAVAGALLASLRTKGETPEEVRGFARAMRRLAHHPDVPEGLRAIDIVGTGGDGSGSYNISSGAALLTAAHGVPVLKHGNRSISSQCGSADVLTALGAPPPTIDRVRVAFEKTNFVFFFAPYFHPAMKNVGPVRQALGIRTIFNILGPLTNPANPPFYLIGAYNPEVAQLMADALAGMSIERAFVIHGAEGWDEATPVGPFSVWDVRPGSVKQEVRDPADFGIERCNTQGLKGGEAAHNAEALRSVFDGRTGPLRDAMTLNAALALEVTGTVKTLAEGLEEINSTLNSGRAGTWLRTLVTTHDRARTVRGNSV